MMNIEKNKFYSISDVSKILSVSEYYVKQFIKTGALRANSLREGFGKRYFIKGEWLTRFLEKWNKGTMNKK